MWTLSNGVKICLQTFGRKRLNKCQPSCECERKFALLPIFFHETNDPCNHVSARMSESVTIVRYCMRTEKQIRNKINCVKCRKLP